MLERAGSRWSSAATHGVDDRMARRRDSRGGPCRASVPPCPHCAPATSGRSSATCSPRSKLPRRTQHLPNEKRPPLRCSPPTIEARHGIESPCSSQLEETIDDVPICRPDGPGVHVPEVPVGDPRSRAHDSSQRHAKRAELPISVAVTLPDRASFASRHDNALSGCRPPMEPALLATTPDDDHVRTIRTVTGRSTSTESDTCTRCSTPTRIPSSRSPVTEDLGFGQRLRQPYRDAPHIVGLGVLTDAASRSGSARLTFWHVILTRTSATRPTRCTTRGGRQCRWPRISSPLPTLPPQATACSSQCSSCRAHICRSGTRTLAGVIVLAWFWSARSSPKVCASGRSSRASRS